MKNKENQSRIVSFRFQRTGETSKQVRREARKDRRLTTETNVSSLCTVILRATIWTVYTDPSCGEGSFVVVALRGRAVCKSQTDIGAFKWVAFGSKVSQTERAFAQETGPRTLLDWTARNNELDALGIGLSSHEVGRHRQEQCSRSRFMQSSHLVGSASSTGWMDGWMKLVGRQEAKELNVHSSGK